MNNIEEVIGRLKTRAALAELIGPDEMIVSASDLSTLVALLEAAQKEITDWRSVAEAAAQDDADWHKLADRDGELICKMANAIIAVGKRAKKAEKERDELITRQSKNGVSRLQSELIQSRISNAEFKQRAEKAEAELSAAQKELFDLHNQEFQQRLANAEHQLYMKDLAIHNIKASRMAQFRKRLAVEAELSAANEKLSKPVVLQEYLSGRAGDFYPPHLVIPLHLVHEAIKKAGFTVEDE